MRTLKFAILGLLNRHPMTGYELTKLFNFELAEFWYTNHSQIYPELKKLHAEGLVEYDIEISGEILETKRYSITPKGVEEFIQWLHKDEKIPRTTKQTFRLRMYFSNDLTLDTRIHLLENQMSQHLKRLNTLNKTAEQYNQVPDVNTDRFGDYIVLRGGIMREQTTIAWLQECIDLCNSEYPKKEE